MKKLFTEHPKSVDQTYFEHAKFSLCLALHGFIVMLAGFFHAIFPFILKDAASKTVHNCADKIRKREEELKRKNNDIKQV